jgi:hypothetical protein
MLLKEVLREKVVNRLKNQENGKWKKIEKIGLGFELVSKKFGQKSLVDRKAGFGGWINRWMDRGKSRFKGLLSALQK